ncbi:hypothetical protein [Plantactinospora soyae]|uniref:Uncharacterized protein n=1 Tax=Plantactinospora soyae TaxID=1544732 RepID=A0A927MGD1_9ACTN|nr:hypothetical protein [Plantactinospora soyae]MBE1492591.1 hypothetical protein [Plantactinospora soyae]
MARQEKKQGQQNSAASRNEMAGMDLHSMRERAHSMGIDGSSKMSEDQLRKAMMMINKGTDPMMAKQEAKGNM